jgi:hypothetical protein
MEKIKIGDLFEIITPRGRAYLHYFYSDIIRGEFLGWHLVDTETWERTLVKSLSSE